MAVPRQLLRLDVDTAVRLYRDYLWLRVAEGRLRPRTAETYLRDLADFVDLVGGGRILDDLEPVDVSTALVAYSAMPDRRHTVSAKLAPAAGARVVGHDVAARARWLAAVRGLFSWATREQYVQLNPMDHVDPVKVPKRASGARLGLSKDRALALRDSPGVAAAAPARRDQRLSLRDEVVLRLLMESGPRVSELCAANRDDVERGDEETFLLIRDGKGGKARRVPMSGALVFALACYQEKERPDPPAGDPLPRRQDAEQALLVTIRGRRMSPRDVQRMVDRHVAQLPDESRRAVTPHGLRHTAATLLLRDSGADVATVAHILGHESVATTSIYLDESDEAAAAAVRRSPIARQ